MLRKLARGSMLLVLAALVLPLILTTQVQGAATAWAPNVAYAAGNLVTYNNLTYQCLQAHTSQTGWEPPNVPALWQQTTSSATNTPIQATNTPTRPPSTTTSVPATATPRPATPTPTKPATSCTYPAWVSSTAYVGGSTVSYNGRGWQAKWWTQNEVPGASSSGVWADLGLCGSSPTPTATPRPATPTPTTPTGSGGFVVTRAQFDQIFPGRNAFYTYDGLVAALSAYPAFANTGDDVTKKREAAAFLANVSHETGGLVYIEEINKSTYCSNSAQYPCAAGKMYYGRGPIQLSWNFNYGAAGQALGLPLLSDPDLVARDASVAWKTGIWYWMTQTGPGTMTPHNAMVNGYGFGETIRSINGSLECNGGNPAQVQSRIDAYQRIVQILGVTAGNNLSC